jgi:formylglycine-generating enzyme required for sulfatase activity
VRSAAWLLALGLLGACSEPAVSSNGAVDPTGAGAASTPSSAASPSITIKADTVELEDHAPLHLRDAAAPGVLDADLRATYRDVAIAAALAETKAHRIVLGKGATVGGLRIALSSLPAARVVELETDGGIVIRVRAAPRGDGLWIRLAGDRIEVRDATGVVANAVTPADLAAHIKGPSVAVELADRRPAADLNAIVGVLAKASVDELVVAMDHAPCVAPPAGMSCVPGGFAIVGSDTDAPEERPRREIELSTYYVDQHEITIEDYDECHAAGGCARRRNGHQKIMQPFVGAKQPMVPLDWPQAVRYCAWAGKRLPSEWEWEKAARGPDGDIYPWGNDEPTCERAQYRECAPRGCKPYPGKQHRWDCNEHDTKPVGTYPAGHYGLFEMAGNGYEWTQTAGVDDPTTCGAACNGRDPQGPCDGASACGNTRVLRGGSWYWPAGRIRGSHRRVEKMRSGNHRLSARCATSQPFLTTFPPAAIEQPLPAVADPEPPTAEQLAIFAAVEQDPIEDKQICSEQVRGSWGSLQAKGGRSETTCRDPFPYLESNEPRAWLWSPYLRNLGGAYMGVGSDQNYTFIALARSQWAWVMDYDPRVVDHHKRLRAFVLEADTPDAFIEMWSSKGKPGAMAAIEKHYAGAPELAKLKRGYLATHERLHAYYREEQAPARTRPEGYGWLANAEHYAYVRKLFAQGRLVPIKGDLLGGKSIQTAAKAASALGVPVRVFYTSNAPSSWGGMITASYRANLQSLPFDRASIVLQTTGKGGFRQSGHWHHNVQWGRHLQERLTKPGYDYVMKMIEERIPTDHGDLTVIGLPAGTSR